MGVDEQFLNKLAEYAFWDLGSSGFRLPSPLLAVISSLSADTEVDEEALTNEVLSRVQCLKSQTGAISKTTAVGVRLTFSRG